VVDPKKASELLGGILAHARDVAKHACTEQALSTILGESVASHCRVAGLSAGRLVIDVDSAPLFAELEGFRREEIRSELNERFEGKFADIAFRLSGKRNV